MIAKLIALLKQGTDFIEALGNLAKAVVFIAMLITGVNFYPTAGEDKARQTTTTIPSVQPALAQTPTDKQSSVADNIKSVAGWAYYKQSIGSEQVVTFNQNSNLRSGSPTFPLYQMKEKIGLIKAGVQCAVLDKKKVGLGKIWLQVRCPISG